MQSSTPDQASNKATQTLVSVVKAAAIVAVGAFFGALNLTTFPTTLGEWKIVLVPAAAAALLAERVYLSKKVPVIRDALLAELRSMSPELSQALSAAIMAFRPLPPSPPETTTTTTTTTSAPTSLPSSEPLPSSTSTVTTSTTTLPAPPASTPPANTTVVG